MHLVRLGNFPANGRATLKVDPGFVSVIYEQGNFPANGRATLKVLQLQHTVGQRAGVISRPMVGLR